MGAENRINPVLAEAEAWAQTQAHHDVLQRAFERFDRNVEWPQLEDLQHDFTVGGRDDIDVATLAYSIPNALGFVEQGRLVLRVRGLGYVGAAAGLLDIWAAALQLACQRWIHDHTSAWLTRKDVEELTHGNRHQTDLVSALLLRERWAFGQGHGNPTDDDWKQKIIETVRIARTTRDPMALLEKRAEIEYPLPPQIPMPIEPERPFEEEKDLRREVGEWLRDAIGNPYAVVIVGGVVVLVIWAVLSNGFHEVFDSGGGGGLTSTTNPGSTAKQGVAGADAHSGEGEESKRFIEEAGEGGASTYANPYTLSEPGVPVEPGQKVQVICRLYAPEPPSVVPDGYWYHLASPPWEGQYYAPANSFWNGDIPGQRPYTHNTDKRVSICKPNHQTRSGLPQHTPP